MPACHSESRPVSQVSSTTTNFSTTCGDFTGGANSAAELSQRRQLLMWLARVVARALHEETLSSTPRNALSCQD